MGKSLIIKDADFSANGIQEQVSILSYFLANASFTVGKALNTFVSASTNNQARCNVLLFKISAYTDWAKYSKVRVTIKSGIVGLLGTGPAVDSVTGWQGWKGTTGGYNFNNSWNDGGNFMEFPTSAASPDCYISMNFKKSDSSNFDVSTALSALVDDVILIP